MTNSVNHMSGPAEKLSRESFEHLKAYTLSILKTPEDIDAMITHRRILFIGLKK